MDLFICLSLLIAIALIFLCVYRDKLANPRAFRKALICFIIAVVAHNPAIDVLALVRSPGVWVVLLRVIAWVFLVLSFRQLCLAFGAPLGDTPQFISKVAELAKRENGESASSPSPKP